MLICDDNYAVHESLHRFLAAENIDCISAYEGEEALKLVQSTHIDLVILDIMLPKLYGTQVCQEIRRDSQIPIIMLSALGTENDRIKGLRLGADDYVTKPFSPEEIAERVKAVLKRTLPGTNRKVLQFAELTVDMDAYCAYIGAERLALTSNEIKILAYFIEHAGIVLSRGRLLTAVWGYDYYGESRAVDAQIKRLRKKLPAKGVHFKIQSIYGVGYRLDRLP